jgi:hypothetical protein
MDKMLKAINDFRSAAFSMAASGKHGYYPYNDAFNGAVEEGFNIDGTTWTANDGTVLYLKDFLDKD